MGDSQELLLQCTRRGSLEDCLVRSAVALKWSDTQIRRVKGLVRAALGLVQRCERGKLPFDSMVVVGQRASPSAKRVAFNGKTQDSGKGSASVLATKGAREREKWRAVLEEEKE